MFVAIKVIIAAWVGIISAGKGYFFFGIALQKAKKRADFSSVVMYSILVITY